MINREKVIRHITAEIVIAKTCKKDFAMVDIDMLSDALDLLKEQETSNTGKARMPDTKVEFIESYIKHGNGDYEWNDNHGELVRCKDCKHYDPETQSCNDGLIGIFLPDWYCADGKRR